MELHATRMSARSARILHEGAPCMVKAVFDYVVNMEACGNAVALQTWKIAFTPLSVEIGRADLEQVKKTDAGNGTKLAIHCARAVDCRIAPLPEPKTSQWGALLGKAGFLFAKEGSLAAAADERFWKAHHGEATPAQRLVHALLQEARRALLERHSEECANILGSLCGLGIGLTPSGDDFLLGVLAVCSCWPGKHAAALRDALSAPIRRLSPQTTWLSRALLDCALEREFALSIHKVLLSGSDAELLQAVAEAVTFGHTSGSDTLGGILWMTNILQQG